MAICSCGRRSLDQPQPVLHQPGCAIVGRLGREPADARRGQLVREMGVEVIQECEEWSVRLPCAGRASREARD